MMIKPKKPDYLNIEVIKNGGDYRISTSFIYKHNFGAYSFIFEEAKNDEQISFGYDFEPVDEIDDDYVIRKASKLKVNKYFECKKLLGFMENIDIARKNADYITANELRNYLKGGESYE